MPRISGSRIDDSCVGSALARTFELDRPLDEAVMRRMAEGGRLQYFPDFPRPYFRIDRPRAYVVQGILGELHLKVTFSPLAADTAEPELRALIESDVCG